MIVTAVVHDTQGATVAVAVVRTTNAVTLITDCVVHALAWAAMWIRGNALIAVAADTAIFVVLLIDTTMSALSLTTAATVASLLAASGGAVAAAAPMFTANDVVISVLFVRHTR